MSRVSRILVVLVLLAAPGASHAQVTCQVSGSAMSFGSYNVLSLVALDSVGSVTITCTRVAGQASERISISLGPSQNSGATNIRRMRRQGGGDLLDYNLFSDPGRSAVWGTGNEAVVQQVVIPASQGTVQRVLEIYGRIPPAQNVSVGSYTDTLTLTVNP